MANLHLVTGSAGSAHVTSADQGVLNCAIFGNGQFVMNRGNKLSATVVSNNQIRILDGDIYMQGRHIRLNENTHVDVAIGNGTQGVNRNDLIVARYTKDLATALEECNLVVIKGTPVVGTATDPTYTVGDIVNGNAILNDMPLYRVPINGLDVGELVCLFDVFEGNLQDIPGKAAEKHNHKASEITEGVVPILRGGTGKDAWEANRLLYASAVDALTQLGLPSSAGSVLRQDASGAPYWTALQDLALALNCGRVAAGSYVGTGKCGSDNPNVLSFSFEPVLVIVSSTTNITADMSNSAHTRYMWPTIMASTSYQSSHGFGYLYHVGNVYPHGKVSADRKTIYWYSYPGQLEPDANYQMNKSGTTYYYIAIGR